VNINRLRPKPGEDLTCWLSDLIHDAVRDVEQAGLEGRTIKLMLTLIAHQLPTRGIIDLPVGSKPIVASPITASEWLELSVKVAGVECARPVSGATVVTADAYDKARAEFKAQAEDQGFEQEPRDDAPLCPVGYCHPGTAESLPARPSGLCGRHWRKVSGPLQHQLQGAQARGEDAAAGMLEQAVLEARRLDDKWHPFAVLFGGHVEPFDSLEHAAKRVHELGAEGRPAALQSSKRGLMTTHQIRAYSPHAVIDATGCTIASAKTLSKAIGQAHREYYDEAANKAGPTWPEGKPPTVVNSWTIERLTWAEACEIAQRGHVGP